MYEILNSIEQNPSQNFNNNSLILKNPKKISKIPKPRSKCMKNERKRTHTKWFETRKDQKSRGLKV